MLAYVNNPDHPDTVTLQEVEEPQPAPHEAVVAVDAFALNRGELTLIARRHSGWRPGQDIAGTVVQAAGDGSGPMAGARVASLVEGAGWSERVAVPTLRLAELPTDFEAGAAAALPLAGITALRLVRLGGSILGRTVLITGASGGLGQLAVQIARLSGAEVIAVASLAHQERLLALGASAVFDSIEAADGRFDLVLESIGGRSLETAVKRVAPGGLILSFGNSSGEPSGFNLLNFFGAENASIRTFFSYASGTEEAIGRDLQTLVCLAESGRLDSSVTLLRPWTELPQVLDAMRRRSFHGKAILQVR